MCIRDSHITVYFDEISFGTTVDGVYNKVSTNQFANNWNTNKNTPNPISNLTADVSDADSSVTLSFDLPGENPVTLYGTKVYQMTDGGWEFIKSADSSVNSCLLYTSGKPNNPRGMLCKDIPLGRSI